MGRDLKELRFLAYHRRVSKTTHYKRFFMPKKSGGERLISAPMPRLKSAQHWILENILGVIPVHDAAHGFVPGRSIVTNAACHVGRSLVVNWDLKNFFPTVTYPRVKGMFKSLGYPEKVATVLALICTEPDADEVELDGERYFVHTSERHLPQGAPTSPAITNILCRKFDARLQGTARSLGYTYSRYADDMTFSASDQSSVEKLNQLIWRVRAVVGDEGFEIHPDKLRIMRKGGRQEVTGLTVNEFETLLMKHDLAEVLRDPLKYMAEKYRNMMADPGAIKEKAKDYMKYDLVHVVNGFIDALGLSESLFERIIDKFFQVPAHHFLRMKRSVSLVVTDGGRIQTGTYQSPILVQWRRSSEGARTIEATFTRFE